MEAFRKETIKMVNKIYVCEPYSYRGGHPYKNIDFFSSIEKFGNYEIKLIADKNSNITRKEIIKYFGEGRLFESSTFEEKVIIRQQEFLNLIKELKDSIIIITTTYEEDITAWFSIFRNVNLLLERNNLYLLIHSAFSVYHSLYEYKKELMEIEKNTNRIFFSFFTELQTEMIKKLFGFKNVFYLYFPHYVNIHQKKNHNSFNERIGYLGAFSKHKNPHYLVEYVSQLPKYEFIIHFSKIDESNFLFVSELDKAENVLLKLGLLNDKEYKKLLNKANFLLLPYNKYEYSVRGSGIFEEAIMNNIFPIVPEFTWMGYKMKEIGLGDYLLNDDYSNIKKILANVKGKWKDISETLSESREIFVEERSLENFFSNIINNVLHSDVSKQIKQKYPLKTIERGIFTYYVKTALFYLWRGDKIKAKEIYYKIKDVEEDYQEYKRLEWLINDDGNINKKVFFELSSLTSWNLNDKFFEINDFSNIWQKPYLLSLNSLLKLVQTKRVSKDVLETLSRQLTAAKSRVLEKRGAHISNRTKSLYYLTMYEINNRCGKDKLAEYYYVEAMKIISKEGKDHINIYRFASFLKTKGKYKEAIKHFNKIIKIKNNSRLKAGAYFHLGEIELWQSNKKKAVQYFEKCLKLNPAHQKARRYLNELKNK